jgi:hypothetical protein
MDDGRGIYARTSRIGIGKSRPGRRTLLTQTLLAKRQVRHFAVQRLRIQTSNVVLRLARRRGPQGVRRPLASPGIACQDEASLRYGLLHQRRAIYAFAIASSSPASISHDQDEASRLKLAPVGLQ